MCKHLQIPIRVWGVNMYEHIYNDINIHFEILNDVII